MAWPTTDSSAVCKCVSCDLVVFTCQYLCDKLSLLVNCRAASTSAMEDDRKMFGGVNGSKDHVANSSHYDDVTLATEHHQWTPIHTQTHIQTLHAANRGSLCLSLLNASRISSSCKTFCRSSSLLHHERRQKSYTWAHWVP